MPQIFQVLRCYKCLVFQVHQTKKSNKWECKLCGEKQSVKRHYGLGTAKDCRLHVQKLNGMRGEIDELKCELNDEENIETEYVARYIPDTSNKVTVSKWSNYVEPAESNQTLTDKTNDDGMYLGDSEVVLELPKKRKRLNANILKKNTNFKTARHSDEHQEVQISHEVCDIPHTFTVFSKKQNTEITQTENSNNNNIPRSCLLAKDEVKLKNVSKKKFTPPAVNKNSKWAQFTGNNEDIVNENEDTSVAPSANIVMSQNDLIFSLCEDDDWDNILNI
ncbi:unnamed protein product [Chrysodeixis includens]|uniref:MRN complex-interacting protein N-terminal domain-containing protein n=1 Tax=Chrysodeixis includens TaxID=689277 RepID=A0A9P0BYP4_CHRIL|nr:unnamed protein product [Chrysodeixis includens]